MRDMCYGQWLTDSTGLPVSPEGVLDETVGYYDVLTVPPLERTLS